MTYSLIFTEQILMDSQAKLLIVTFLSATSKFRNRKIKENITICQKAIAN